MLAEPGSTNERHTLILLHGAIGAADQLKPLAEELTKLQYQVFTFSFSGHGQTPFHSDFGIEQFATELKKFILENDLDRPHVVGYSMGGYVALYLASQQPDLIGKIVTLGTKFRWTREVAEKEVKQLDPETIVQKVPKFADALQMRHGNDWRQLLQNTASMMRAMGEINPLSDELLMKIENDVLVGLADKDAMVSLDETIHVYKLLRNSHMYMLPNTKHPIESINLNIWLSILNAFLK